MLKGYTEKEAKKLVGQSFEPTAPLSGVPMRVHGLVVEAIDCDDHWNVMIEWRVPGKPFKEWYNKDDMRNYMRPVPPAADSTVS
jgi:hypothetical protein